MTESQVDITFTCESCEGNAFELPDNYTDLSLAKRKNCGIELAVYGEIKAKARELAVKKVRDDVPRPLRD